jgi:hypothetical protein
MTTTHRPRMLSARREAARRARAVTPSPGSDRVRLSRGYLGDPERTARCFVPRPGAAG